MATVIVHDVDEAALEQWGASLARIGSSVEAEVRSMIERHADAAEAERLRRADAALATMSERLGRLHDKYGKTIDLTGALLQERAEG